MSGATELVHGTCVALGRTALRRLGPAGTAALLPAAVGLGALGAIVVPGVTGLSVARSTEKVITTAQMEVAAGLVARIPLVDPPAR